MIDKHIIIDNRLSQDIILLAGLYPNNAYVYSQFLTNVCTHIIWDPRRVKVRVVEWKPLVTAIMCMAEPMLIRGRLVCG